MVQAPEGCWGIGATNKTKVPARMTIRRGEDVLYDSGDKTYNDKQWLLLRDNDVRTLNAKVGFKVGELAGLQWASIHIMWGFYFAHFFSSTNLSFMAAYKQKWDEGQALPVMAS